MANELGKIRRSWLISTCAPGAIVDFRAGGAPVSAVVGGLEEWDEHFPPEGARNPQIIREPRLERKLGVQAFRLPPVTDSTGSSTDQARALPARRFPEWLQCPRCDRLAQARRWGEEPGKAGRHCPACTARVPGRRKVYVLPVRFVMACERGHLDEFPFHTWVGHLPHCTNRDGPLFLRTEKPGLAGLVLSCEVCKSKRDFDGVFAKRTWRDKRCRGRVPWLGAPDEGCEANLRAVQRGASNLHFPAIESALSIPAWSDTLQEELGNWWHALVMASGEVRLALINGLAASSLRDFLAERGMTAGDLFREVERRVSLLDAPDASDIRGAEYRQFTMDHDYASSDDNEFETRSSELPPELRKFFTRIVRVVRLREVRALMGFTRINPPVDGDDPMLASLSVASPANRTWLPACEVRGEGIFIELDSEALDEWNPRVATTRAHLIVEERTRRLDEAAAADWRSRGKDPKKHRPITARHLLVHTFAHALMRQMTLDCGYSSSSLRERLYIRNDHSGKMAGVLVYTSTSDADGTLGGLQRQGEARRIAGVIRSAIRAMEWCSSDPLCMEGLLSATEKISMAACHSCALAPETSCEEYNRHLDRAMLVGTPEEPSVGFFRRMIDG
jgi:hypothetical protein